MTTSAEPLKREVFFSPAFDKRTNDPNTNYGVGAVRITFVVSDERGAMQFVIGTDWYPEHVQQEPKFRTSPLRDAVQPNGWDVGYHSPVPRYDGQSSMGACQHLGGRECYYDGSSLQAEPVVGTLLREGSDGVWKYLEMRHAEMFGNVEVDA